MNQNYELFDWQKEAYASWKANKGIGTIEVATGSGKTVVAVHSILTNQGTTLFVVPTIKLMTQTKERLVSFLGVEPDEIGLIYGKEKQFDKRIKVAVVNSLRELELTDDLLILDEAHRYCSEENIKFIQKGKFRKILCMTATLKRDDELHKRITELAPIVYTYSQREAIEDDRLSEFVLTNCQVQMLGSELQVYQKADKYIKDNFPRYGNNFAAVQARRDHTLLKAFGSRKMVLNKTFSKVRGCLLEIMNERDSNGGVVPKTIIFSEFKDIADTISEKLASMKIRNVKYYSGIDPSVISEYEAGVARVLVTVKALDEGLDVPDTEVAMIIGGSGVKRQMIQRVGRVLRKKEGKIARVYQFYVKGTQDESWMKNRSIELFRNAQEVRWQ